MTIGVLSCYLQKLGNIANFCPPPISYPEQK